MHILWQIFNERNNKYFNCGRHLRHVSIQKSTHIEGEGCSTADTLIHMVTNDAIILHFMQQTTDI